MLPVATGPDSSALAPSTTKISSSPTWRWAGKGAPGLVFPDPLLADARTRLDPRQIAEREDLRRGPAGPLRERLHPAGEDRQDRGTVGRRDGVDTAVRPVAHVARGDRPEFVGDGALDDEDQLVAGVPMQWQLGAGRDPGHGGPTLALGMLPDVLAANPGLALLPRQIAERDDLRQRRLRRAHRGFSWLTVRRAAE